MNKGILSMGIVLIVGIAAGYAGAYYQYAEKFARVQLAFPEAPMTSVIGTIRSVSGNTITLEMGAPMNPLEDLPKERTITVTEATSIVKESPKDMKVFAQEMNAYQKSIQKSVPAGTSTAPSASTTMTPPQPFTETSVSLSDLKVGDMIRVEAGKDIKTASRFEAEKIVLITTAAPADAAPAAGITAPIVNDKPSVRTDGGSPPIVNTPPPAKP